MSCHRDFTTDVIAVFQDLFCGHMLVYTYENHVWPPLPYAMLHEQL